MAITFNKKSEEAEASKPAKAPKASPKASVENEDDPPFETTEQAAAATTSAKKTATKKAANPKGHPKLAAALETLGKVEHVQPKATITQQHGTGVETTETENVGPVIEKTKPMANVGLSVGATVNLGNFNNAKFSVSLFMPSELDKESLDSTFEFVNEWVEAKANALHAELGEEE